MLLAVLEDDATALREAINNGVNVNERFEDDFTPLMIAVGRGHTENVRLLLQAGADINAMDSHRDTPLLIAAANGNTYERRRLILFDGHDEPKRLPQFSSPRGYTEILGFLIDRGANIGITDADGNSAILCAIIGDNDENLHTLVGIGAPFGVHNKYHLDEAGTTVVLMTGGLKKMVKHLR